MAPYDDAVTDDRPRLRRGRARSTRPARSPTATAAARPFSCSPRAPTPRWSCPTAASGRSSELDVRATEYTIGESGRAAMPGALPTASGYTYAVELSVDQAIEAGATEVRFSKPVINYVDNFLNFPAGGVVPSGYYDREAGQWVPVDDGRVIAIVGESGGLAEVDTDGDGSADSGLGITDAERQRLAAVYDPGKSLWRVAIEHFTPYDHNWPYAPPLDAVPPRVPVPNQNRPQPKKECWVPGSIIGCEGQRLGQSAARHRHAVRPALLERPHARLRGRDQPQHPARRRHGAEPACSACTSRSRSPAASTPGRTRPSRTSCTTSSGTARTPTAASSRAPSPSPSASATSTASSGTATRADFGNAFGRLSGNGLTYDGARDRDGRRRLARVPRRDADHGRRLRCARPGARRLDARLAPLVRRAQPHRPPG